MTLKRKRYYFLPFLDNLFAVLISLLIMMFFGSWLKFRLFGMIAGVVATLTMCGFIYSRMWKLSRKNTQYNLGLGKSDFMKFLLPIVLFHLVLIVYFLLAQSGIIPLKDEIIKIYYTFPDNLPREAVYITTLDYLAIFVKFWFAYFLHFSQNLNPWFYLAAPILVFVSGMLGFHMGAKNKEMLHAYGKLVDKAKDKFNE